MISRGDHAAQSFEDAWASRGRAAPADDVADLVRTAEMLCRSAVAEPSDTFRSDLRSRLMTEAADVLVAAPARERTRTDPAPARPHLRRRLAGVTAALVAGVGCVGMVSTSASAHPGDVLYPVKRGVESAQLLVERDDVGRGELQLRHASERLDEATWLAAHGREDRVADTLEDFSDQATEGSETLFEAYDADGSAATIEKVNDFAAAATVQLTTLDDLPADAAAALKDAAGTVSDLAAQTQKLCGSCRSVDVTELAQKIDTSVAGTSSGDKTSASKGGGAKAPSDSVTTVPSESIPSTGGGTTTKPTVPDVKKTPSLKDVTDPVIKGVLGDEDGKGGLVDDLLK